MSNQTIHGAERAKLLFKAAVELAASDTQPDDEKWPSVTNAGDLADDYVAVADAFLRAAEEHVRVNELATAERLKKLEGGCS